MNPRLHILVLVILWGACSHYEKCRGDSLHTGDFDKNEPQICYCNIDKLLKREDALKEEKHIEMKKNHGTFVSLLINPQKKQIAAYSNSVYVPIDLELLTDEEINFAKGIFLGDYIK